MLGLLGAVPLTALAAPLQAFQGKPKKPKKGAKVREIASLRWTGTAKINVGGNGVIEVGVDTTIVPFVSARSDSWLLVAGEGPAKRRTLVIEPADGWTERNGKRDPLPAGQVAHERQQYGVYGYLLGMGKEVSKSPGRRRLQQPGYPPADIYYDGDRVAIIDYLVDPPRAGPKLTERFTFTGELVSNEVKWPQKITILQDLRPFYELNITNFEAAWK